MTVRMRSLDDDNDDHECARSTKSLPQVPGLQDEDEMLQLPVNASS